MITSRCFDLLFRWPRGNTAEYTEVRETTEARRLDDFRTTVQEDEALERGSSSSAGASTGPVTITVSSRQSNPFQFIVQSSSGKINPDSGPQSGGNRVVLTIPPGLSGAYVSVLFGPNQAGGVQVIPPNTVVCTAPPGTGTVEVSAVALAVTRLGNYTYR